MQNMGKDFLYGIYLIFSQYFIVYDFIHCTLKNVVLLKQQKRMNNKKKKEKKVEKMKAFDKNAARKK